MPGRAQAPRLRPLVNMRMGLLSVAAFVSYFGAAGLPFLVSLHAEEHLGIRPDLTGVALLGFGLTGLLLGASWGSLGDRFGARRCGAIAAALGRRCAGDRGVGRTGAVRGPTDFPARFGALTMLATARCVRDSCATPVVHGRG